MNPADTMAVEPSEVPVSLETEPTTPSVETPTEPVAPTEPTEPTEPPVEPPAEPELYELPDGRKVDAATLSKEWKENFYPEYTRKSQALAAKDTTITIEPTKSSLDDWVPTSYAEIVEKAKQEMKLEREREEKEQEASIKAVEDAVSTQLTEVKTKDPTVNETALFQHAMKYGFRDLRLAHQNMQDMANVIKTTQQVTARNVQKRTDPVSVTPGATGARPDPSQFKSAQDYLRSLKN